MRGIESYDFPNVINTNVWLILADIKAMMSVYEYCLFDT